MKYYMILMTRNLFVYTRGPFSTWGAANNAGIIESNKVINRNTRYIVTKECVEENRYGAPKALEGVFNFEREEDYPDDNEG